jgi:primosomal protein N' (replication factor Y)
LQQQAFDEINTSFESHNTVLLHGVTSSGKTYIYFKLIEEQMKQGKAGSLSGSGNCPDSPVD